MNLPNFLLIGAQKSGTTTLARILGEHPDVFMAEREIHFFDKSHNQGKGLEWYSSHFHAACHEKAIEEKTPDYLWVNGTGAENHLPDVHKHIASVLPTAKIIVILRNPVNRAVSAANHVIRTGRVSPLLDINELLISKKRHLFDPHGVIDKGMYFKQLKSYLDLFSRDQILILIFEEDIVKNLDGCLRKVFHFLEVDPSFIYKKSEKQFNRFNASKAAMILRYYFPFIRGVPRYCDRYLPRSKFYPTSETINILKKIYKEENENLFELLQYRPPSWD